MANENIFQIKYKWLKADMNVDRLGIFCISFLQNKYTRDGDSVVMNQF